MALCKELAAYEENGEGTCELPQVEAPSARNYDQFVLLVQRQTTSLWRNGAMPRVVIYIGFGVLIGTTLFQVEMTLPGAIFRIAGAFYAVFVAIVPANAAIASLVQQRAAFYRETSSGTYSHWVYSIAQLCADLPLHLATSLIFTLIFYWAVGYQSTFFHVFYFWLMTLFIHWLLPSFGQFFAFAAPNLEAAIGLAGLFIIFMVLLMGFLISFSAMPDGWHWAYWINLLHYALQGYCTNELAGQQYLIPLAPIIEGLLPSNTSLDFGSGKVMAVLPHATGGLDFQTLATALAALLVDLKSLPPAVAELKAALVNATGKAALLTCFKDHNCFDFGPDGKLNPQGLIDCVLPGKGHMVPKCAVQATAAAHRVAGKVSSVRDCMSEPNATLTHKGQCALVAILPPSIEDALVPLAVILSSLVGDGLVLLLPLLEYGLLIPGDVSDSNVPTPVPSPSLASVRTPVNSPSLASVAYRHSSPSMCSMSPL